MLFLYILSLGPRGPDIRTGISITGCVAQAIYAPLPSRSHQRTMLSRIIDFFTPLKYDSFILLLLSPNHSHFVHLVPEEPGIVEYSRSSSSDPTRLHRFPRGVSPGSRELLGELEINVTEGDSLRDAILRMIDHIEEAYKADTASIGDTLGDTTAGVEPRLRYCEHSLRRGFSAMPEGRQDKERAGAIPNVYPVELVRISRSKPGRIWGDSAMTSFPH